MGRRQWGRSALSLNPRQHDHEIAGGKDCQLVQGGMAYGIQKARKGLIVAIRLFALVGALLLLVPMQAAAADVRTGNGEQTIGSGTTITDDLYIFGNTVNVQGTVDGTVIAAGGTVAI